MMSWTIVALAFCLSVTAVTTSDDSSSSCQDIDTNACALLAAQKPNFCADPIVAQRTCPRYCKLCPLECYQCNTTVSDFHMCNTTIMCAEGEVCMRKQLKSFVDSHVEYELTCESKQACDGLGLVFPFGKRSIESRDVSVHCCDKDRCNYPAEMTTPIAYTAAPTTSINQGCKKDVIAIVDESKSLVPSARVIKDFLRMLFNSLAIGQNGVLMSLATFSTTVKPHWNLGTHTDKSDLMAAISGITFRGGNGDLDVAINHAIGQVDANSILGNRPDSPDVVLFITDDPGRSFLQEFALERQLHRKADNVIVIGIGSHVTTAELTRLATDAQHEFHLHTANSLSQLDSRIAQLICENSSTSIN